MCRCVSNKSLIKALDFSKQGFDKKGTNFVLLQFEPTCVLQAITDPCSESKKISIKTSAR